MIILLFAALWQFPCRIYFFVKLSYCARHIDRVFLLRGLDDPGKERYL